MKPLLAGLLALLAINLAWADPGWASPQTNTGIRGWETYWRFVDDGYPPAAPEYLVEVGDFYLLEMFDLEGARALYQQALASQHPRPWQCHYRLGHVCLLARDREGARAHFELARQLKADQPK